MHRYFLLMLLMHPSFVFTSDLTIALSISKSLAIWVTAWSNLRSHLASKNFTFNSHFGKCGKSSHAFKILTGPMYQVFARKHFFELLQRFVGWRVSSNNSMVFNLVASNASTAHDYKQKSAQSSKGQSWQWDMKRNKSKVTWNQILKARDGTRTTSSLSEGALCGCCESPWQTSPGLSRSWLPWRARENAVKGVAMTCYPWLANQNETESESNLQTYWRTSHSFVKPWPTLSSSITAAGRFMATNDAGLEVASLISNALQSERGYVAIKIWNNRAKYTWNIKLQHYEALEATVPSAPRNHQDHQEIAKKGNATWNISEETRRWWNMYIIQTIINCKQFKEQPGLQPNRPHPTKWLKPVRSRRKVSKHMQFPWIWDDNITRSQYI